jgi:hypothetical protein
MTSSKRLLSVVIPFALLSAWASPADAVLIDLRSPAYAPADGANSFSSTVDGVTLTFLPLPTPEARLYWDSTDGFGVRYDYEVDEIEGRETLSVLFSEAVYLEEIRVTDLFYENGYLERGSYELDDSGSLVQFTALASQGPGTNGERTLLVGAWTSSIDFRAAGRVFGQNHEFSVAGLRIRDRVEPTPEPASVLLFAVGGAVAASAVRRSRSRG